MSVALLAALKPELAARVPLPDPVPAGQHPAVSWAAWRRTHDRCCLQCRPEAPCPLRRALHYACALGHHPGDVTVPATPSSTAAKRRRAEASGAVPTPTCPTAATAPPPHQTDAIEQQLQSWCACGVLTVSAASHARDHVAAGGFTAAMFVVTVAKAAAGRGTDLAEYLAAAPGRVAALWLGDLRLPTGMARLKTRVITDARPLNAAIPPPPALRYPTITGVAADLVQHSLAAALSGGPSSGAPAPHEGWEQYLVVLDFTQGYTTVRVAAAAAAWLAVLAPDGTVYDQHRLPFGYAWAAFIFCLLSAAAAQVMCRAAGTGTKAWVYVDDVLLHIWAPSREAASQAVSRAITAVEELGFVINTAKSQGPACSVVWIGAKLELVAGGVALAVPDDVAPVLRVACLEAAHSVEWPKRAWQRLIGKLVAVWTLVPGARWHTAHLFRMLGRNGWAQCAPRSLHGPTPAQREALQWWAAALRPGAGSATVPHTTAPAHQLVAVAATDASGSPEEGLGVLLALFDSAAPAAAATGAHAHPSPAAACTCTPIAALARSTSLGAMFTTSQAPPPRPGAARSSTELELAAIALAARVTAAAVATSAPGRQTLLCIATDSQAAVALLNKGYSLRSPAAHALLRVIDEAAGQGVLLDLRWVPREHNVWADFCSHPQVATEWLPDLQAALARCGSAAEARALLSGPLPAGAHAAL